MLNFTGRHEKEYFCTKAATLQKQSAFFVDFSNQVCTLIAPCNNYKKTSTPPLFKAVVPAKKYLLFRTRRETGIDPIQALRFSPANESQLSNEDFEASEFYKSPLLSMAPYSLFESIDIIFFRSRNTPPAVNLSFTYSPNKVFHDPDAWFTSHNLLASSPWRKIVLKSALIFRLYDKNNPETFFISGSQYLGNCSGFLLISSSTCTCMTNSICPHSPMTYLYSGNYGPVDWNANSIPLDDLVIFGKISSSNYRYYVRTN